MAGPTTHVARHGDARDLSFIPSESIHLLVTSGPSFTGLRHNRVKHPNSTKPR